MCVYVCVSTFSGDSPRPLNNFSMAKYIPNPPTSLHFHCYALGASHITSHWPHSNSLLLVFLWFPAYQINLFKKAEQIRSLIKIFYLPNEFQGFPSNSAIKNPACNAGDAGSVPGSGRTPGGENGNPLQYSFLENPMDRGTWQAKHQRVTRAGHDWVSTHTHTHNGLPAPSAQRIKFKLLISSQPLPMFSTYYKPPLIAVHPSSVFLLFFKHSSSPALQTCLFLISLFPNQSVPGQPIKNSLLTPGTITYSVYLCLFSACLSHQTVSSMKEEIKSIFPSSFI